MTIVSTANAPTTDIATSILNEFDGGSSTEIDMMIGIGLVKDSDAGFFQYTGEKQHRALLRPTTGKPITRLSDVRLSGISVAEDVGQYKQTKLNLFLETSAGRQVMVTSGLETIWTQCLLSSLMGLELNGQLLLPFNLDSWKGDANGVCFAGIRVGREKVSDQGMYDQYKELRADRAKDKILDLGRSTVQILAQGLGQIQSSIDEVVVEELTTTSDDSEF